MEFGGGRRAVKAALFEVACCRRAVRAALLEVGCGRRAVAGVSFGDRWWQEGCEGSSLGGSL